MCRKLWIKYIAKVQELDSNIVFNNIKEFIINEFKKELSRQVSKKTSFDVRFQLQMFNDTSKGVDGIKKQLDNLINSINIDNIYNIYFKEFNSYIEDNNYSKILKVYNRKSLSGRISNYFELANNKYPDFVLRLMNSSHKKDITKILKAYTPDL